MSYNSPYDYNYDNMTITLSDPNNGTNGSSVFTISSNTALPLINGPTGQYNWSATDTITLGDYSNITNNGLHVNGDANFEGDVKIKGKSLVDSLEKIEEKLAILRPNEKLEEKWDNLRALRKAYMELEAEIIEKEKMWDILKK